MRNASAVLASAFALVTAAPVAAQTAAPSKPNIVIIWGDGVGQSNISGYSRGLMGYRTPNIDRIANEGMCPTAACGSSSRSG